MLSLFHFGKSYKAEYNELGVIYTELQREHAALEKERNAWKARAHEVEDERNELKEQVEAARKECTRLSDYAVEQIEARVRAEHARIALEVQMENGTKQPVEVAPALATEIKQSRTRKKPLAKVETNNG